MVNTPKHAVLLALALALWLAVMVVVPGDIGHEVHGPSANLLTESVNEGSNRSLFSQLVELVNGTADASGVNGPRLGNEDHVTLHVAGSLVVLAVGNLPGEVGDKEKGVADPADGVVEDLVGREGLVAALVGQNPQTSTEETLEDGVQSPEQYTSRHRGHRLRGHVFVEYVEGSGQRSEIAGDVAKTTNGGALKAVLGNGIADLLDRVVGNLKLVAIRVQKDTAGVLGGLRGFVHGREGGVGGRVDGRVERRIGNRRGSRLGCHVSPQLGLLRAGSGGSHVEKKVVFGESRRGVVSEVGKGVARGGLVGRGGVRSTRKLRTVGMQAGCK